MSPRGKTPAKQLHTFDVVVVCALDDELAKLKGTVRGGWERFSLPDDPAVYFKSTFASKSGAEIRVVASAANQMGLATSAVLTTKMILHFRPKLVGMVGIAAGAKNEGNNFGDILIAEHTFDYGSGKININPDGKAVFQPDHQPLPIEPHLLGRLKDWKSRNVELAEIVNRWPAAVPQTALRIHVGPLGSGAAVVNSREVVAGIQTHWRKLIGLEMEAYAAHRACNDTVRSKPMFLCCKSICDFAENKTDGWRDYAAFTAAEFFHKFVVTEWEELFPQNPR